MSKPVITTITASGLAEVNVGFICAGSSIALIDKLGKYDDNKEFEREQTSSKHNGWQIL